MIKMNCLRLLLTAAVVAALPLIANNAPAAVGDIYESNQGMILRFPPSGGTPGTFASNLSNPKGLAFDGNGHLYVADATRGDIYRFSTLDGSQAFTFAAGLSSPVGLTFDQTGNLFESDAGSGTIFKFSTVDGTRTTFATGVGAPAGLAFDGNGNLFVADFAGGAIYKITPDGTKSTFASGLSFPAGLAIDSANNVFEADSGSGTIFKFTPDGTRTTFATGLSTLTAWPSKPRAISLRQTRTAVRPSGSLPLESEAPFFKATLTLLNSWPSSRHPSGSEYQHPRFCSGW